MPDITTALGVATTLFAGVGVLAILVTGFYVGRSWLRKMGDGDGGGNGPWI